MKHAILLFILCGVAIGLFAQTPTIVKATGSYCEGSGATFYLNTSQTCTSYSWTVHGGTKGVDYDYTYNDQNYFSVSWLKPRNSVYVSCSYLCDNNYGTAYSDNFDVLETVTAYSVGGGGSYCSGGSGLSITLSGSVSNVYYELYVNGAPVSGSTQTGNGSPLTWANQKTGGTYTVKASACPVDMSGSATITVNSLPAVYTVGGGGSYCSGSGGVSITLGGSQTGVDYQLKVSNSNVGSPIAGTGSSLTWTNQTIGGTYTVVATNATTLCQSTMNGSATVTENATPRIFSVTGGGEYCSGTEGVPINLAGSELDVSYQLMRDGADVPISPIDGTGGELTWGNQTIEGFYTVRATGSNGCPAMMGGEKEVIIIPRPTTADAGVDQTGFETCGLTSVTLAANSPTVGTGLWSILSGSGGSLANPSNWNSTFSGTAGSTYVLRWTISNSPCPASTDDMTVTFNRHPTAAKAGLDQTDATTCGLTSVTLAGNSPSIGSGLWSVVSGSNGSFVDQDSPTSTFSGTAGATYVLRWTISNSPCASSSDDVTVKFNQNPTTAYAGSDQTGASTCGATSVILGANTPSVGTGEWTIVSGIDGHVFNSLSPSSTFSGIAGNTYTLRWRISNSPCTASADDVVIKFNQNPTTATAGLDQTGSSTCGLTSVTLNANTPAIGTGSWTVISGAGGYFANSSSSSSLFSGNAGVAYTLRWAINNTPCPASTDDVNITFNVDVTSTASVTGTSRFGSGSLNLAATGAQSGEDYKWYNASDLLLHTGSPYPTPVVDSSVPNYCYVQIENSASCAGPKTWVNIDVYPIPVVNSAGDLRYLSYGNTIQLSTSGYYSYQWAKDGVNILGGTFQNLAATEPGVYTVKVKGSANSPEAISDGFTIYDAIPSQDENYISTVTFLREGANTSALFTLKPEHYSQSTTYFDGLGRPMQTVATMGSPNQKDIVQPIIYDEFGREFRKYLPFAPDENTGRYKDNASVISSSGDYIGIAKPFYDSPDTKVADDDVDRPYAETKFDNSPLDRVVEQGAAGLVWHPDGDNTIRIEYQTNTDTEVLLWTYSGPTDSQPLGLVNATDASNLPVHYGSNQLFKNVTKDENSHEVIEYKDKEGRIVLKRVQAAEPPLTMGDSDYASTYYIYDDFGQLVCVVPPEAVERLPTEYYHTGADNSSKEAFLSKWAFRYRYDERRRMIMKQVPGADSVTMVYDKRDRLVLTQDGNQRDANEWLFTKYDELNRPVMTGIYAHGSTIDRDDMDALVSTTSISETYDGTVSNYGYSNNVFPTSNVEVLTVTYYDKYDFKSLFDDPNDDPNGIFDFKSDELTASNGLKAQEQVYFPRVRNQVTGSATRILNSSTFLWSVNYYDDRYRLIQSTTSNHKDGVDRTTNVYDFVGKVLRTKTRYLIPGHATHPDTKILKRFSYDHAGRLLKTWHQIEGGPEVVISSNEYNELGQLVTKKLHQMTYDGTPVTADPLADQAGTNYDKDLTSSSYSTTESTYVASNSIRLLPGFTVPLSSTFQAKIGYSAEDALAYNNSIEGEYLQEIDYRYNIRGWMKRINDPAAPVSDDLFNMELHYNTPSANGGDPQYNGNISEAIWKSAGLDRQSYGYDYDPMNRIMEGKYYNLAKPTQNGRYDEMMGDPADLINYPAYDLNGNIQNLVRNGKTDVGTYGLMDKLHYDYGTSGGNRLMFVSDAKASGAQEEGFKEIVEGTTDYAYDENGNLIKDENKGITGDAASSLDGIEYNHLNLPWKVSKNLTDYIIYTYDATGRKLAQQVFGGEAKTTDYLGELVFEDSALQFILHSEGRVVFDIEAGAPDPWEYQYFLKDHLGNTRVVFGEKMHSQEYKVTFEDDRQDIEMADFPTTYPASRSGMNEFDHTDPGSVYNKSMMLHGGDNNQVGLAKSFAVNPGDVLDLEVYAKYREQYTTPTDLNDLFTGIVSAFSLGTASSPLDGAAAYSAMENIFQGGGPWINSSMWEDAPPKAYLNYILFDENFTLVDFGFDQISTAGEQVGTTPVVAHDYLSLHVKVEQKGYLYVYLSNEQPTLTNVYFDDMKVVHYSAVEQVNDYYPFGLTFNSYQRENSIAQDYKYNGMEVQDELNLGWYDYIARQYDPAVSRFTSLDPAADLMRRHSPYTYAFDNPIRFVDYDGMVPSDTVKRPNQNAQVVVSPPPTILPVAPGTGAGGSSGCSICDLQESLIGIPGPHSSSNQEEQKKIEEKEPAKEENESGNPSKTETEEQENVVYRGGSAGALNLTPREKDQDGLSTFRTHEQATQGKGGKSQVLDVEKLKQFGFEVIESPNGHVSIRPPSQQEHQSWIGSRKDLSSGKPQHVRTSMVQMSIKRQHYTPEKKR